ncbi:unnamed protein product, partial [Allacma fusca]
GHCDILRTGIS